MTKEVLISISGLHLVDGEDGDVEVITAGTYAYRDGRHYLFYDEVVEGMSGHISNRIEIGGGVLEVTKRGLTSAKMVFEKGERHAVSYQTPFGIMELGILGLSLTVRESEDAIDVQAEYILEIAGQEFSQSSLSLKVRPREEGSLRLTDGADAQEAGAAKALGAGA